jgi:6-phosphogluconolactonase
MRLPRLIVSVGCLALLAGSAGVADAAADPAQAKGRILYVGTRADGPGAGITALRFDPVTGRLSDLGLAVEVARPTWLLASPHRAIVYSVSEVGNDGKAQASVYSFSADAETGRLTQISKVASGGGGATHLLLDAKTLPPTILVSNYGGQVSAVPLGHDGVLGAVSSVQTDVGSGPLPRQSSAHPHGTAIDATGRFVFVSDLGADRIFIYRLDPATRTLTPARHPSVALQPGSGPRHIVFHPSDRFAYANDELTGTITLLGWDAKAETLSVLKDIPTRGPGYAGEISSGELMLSPDGRFLTVSSRGEDVLIVYAVDAATGDLREIERLPSGGKAPASFVEDQSGRWLVAANEESGTLTVFARDKSTGRLKRTGEAFPQSRPTGIAFLLQAP